MRSIYIIIYVSVFNFVIKYLELEQHNKCFFQKLNIIAKTA